VRVAGKWTIRMNTAPLLGHGLAGIRYQLWAEAKVRFESGCPLIRSAPEGQGLELAFCDHDPAALDRVGVIGGLQAGDRACWITPVG
jgi:hypothetical protein